MSKLTVALAKLFHRATVLPTPEENRLYACVANLADLQALLEERVLPLPEVHSLPHYHTNDLKTWSFDQVLFDKLQDKGWNTWPPFPQRGGQLAEDVANAIRMLRDQPRKSFDMLVADYKKPSHQYAEAMDFICRHVGELEDAVAELQTFTAADVKPCHRATLIANPRPSPNA